MGRDTDPVNWYSTRELQVISCVACRCFEKQSKLENSRGDPLRPDFEQFHKDVKHNYPKWRQCMPQWTVDIEPHMDVRLFSKARAMNTFPKEHPTHISNANTTGRYWDAVCVLVDAPHEYTPTEKWLQELIDTHPATIISPTPEEINQHYARLDLMEKFISDMREVSERLFERPK